MRLRLCEQLMYAGQFFNLKIAVSYAIKILVITFNACQIPYNIIIVPHQKGPKLVVEIFDFKDSLFTGLSHLYYEGDKYEHYKISGRYLKQDSLLVFRETVTISVDLGIYGNCLGTYLMKLSGKGNTDMLDGIWMSNKKYCTDDVKVWLKKEKAEIKVETIAAKKPPLVTKPVIRTKPNPQLPVAKRQTTTVVTSPTAPRKHC
ncbi:MAG: hypothetical protein IPF72_00710 [Chitinophagaceae bacterium]|nr:hypothetical protein [Chitinophagaceae bacterium]